MPSFTALYTKPDTEEQAQAFLEEYTSDHLPIAARFPKLASSSTTVFSGTPRGGQAPYFVMFHGIWETQADMDDAMRDPSLMEASKHAMGMLKKYGNSAEMLVGDEA